MTFEIPVERDDRLPPNAIIMRGNLLIGFILGDPWQLSFETTDYHHLLDLLWARTDQIYWLRKVHAARPDWRNMPDTSITLPRRESHANYVLGVDMARTPDWNALRCIIPPFGRPYNIAPGSANAWWNANVLSIKEKGNAQQDFSELFQREYPIDIPWNPAWNTFKQQPPCPGGRKCSGSPYRKHDPSCSSFDETRNELFNINAD